MAKPGDIVRFLNSVGGGRVTRVDGQIAYVDEDGFETPVLLRECVVVGSASDEPKAPKAAKATKGAKAESAAYASSAPAQRPAEPEPVHVIETAEGDVPNIVLAFQPVDAKRLSDTTFEARLVNDSNYFLSVAFLSRAASDEAWTLRRAATVEPGYELLLCELGREDIPALDRIAIQCIAYKQGREFKLQEPVSVEHKVDTTKFFKLHCFQPNPYFDTPVLAFPIVTDGKPYRRVDLAAALAAAPDPKPKSEDRPARRPVRKPQPKDGPLVVDLHLTELVDNTAGLTPADMLNIQVEKFRTVMDSNLRRRGLHIVFIHGKGDGVLRKAILKELGYRYKQCSWHDASFQEYGYGATEVVIR